MNEPQLMKVGNGNVQAPSTDKSEDEFEVLETVGMEEFEEEVAGRKAKK